MCEAACNEYIRHIMKECLTPVEYIERLFNRRWAMHGSIQTDKNNEVRWFSMSTFGVEHRVQEMMSVKWDNDYEMGEADGLTDYWTHGADARVRGPGQTWPQGPSF